MLSQDHKRTEAGGELGKDPTQPVAIRPLAIQKDGTWYSAPTRPAAQGSPSQVCSGLGGLVA